MTIIYYEKWDTPLFSKCLDHKAKGSIQVVPTRDVRERISWFWLSTHGRGMESERDFYSCLMFRIQVWEAWPWQGHWQCEFYLSRCDLCTQFPCQYTYTTPNMVIYFGACFGVSLVSKKRERERGDYLSLMLVGNITMERMSSLIKCVEQSISLHS